MRMFFSGAIEVELDKQGRINIPQNLRSYANLSKECTVIGVSNRIEIWDRSTWNDFMMNLKTILRTLRKISLTLIFRSELNVSSRIRTIERNSR